MIISISFHFLLPSCTFIVYGDLLPEHLVRSLWDGNSGPHHESSLSYSEMEIMTKHLKDKLPVAYQIYLVPQHLKMSFGRTYAFDQLQFLVPARGKHDPAQ